MARPALTAAGPLVSLYQAIQRGEDGVPPAVPPTLVDRSWKFLCNCGTTWRVDHADADVRHGQVVPPRRACTACHTWVTGRATPL